MKRSPYRKQAIAKPALRADPKITAEGMLFVGVARVFQAGNPPNRPAEEFSAQDRAAFKTIDSLIQSMSEDSAAPVLLAVSLMFGVRVVEREERERAPEDIQGRKVEL